MFQTVNKLEMGSISNQPCTAASLTHQNDTSCGRSELEEDPLVGVGPPHAESVSRSHPQGHQSGCSLLHLQTPTEAVGSGEGNMSVWLLT